MTSLKSALIGFLLALPIGLLYLTVHYKLAPLESVLKSVLTSDGMQPNVFGRIYMLVGLLLLPVSLIVSVWPMLKKRQLYICNLLVALIVGFLVSSTWGELISEIYRCDILHVPNCD